MIQQHSSNDKSLTTANGITNNKVIIHTSKSAPLVAKIRQRFFENEWPKNAGKFLLFVFLIFHIFLCF